MGSPPYRGLVRGSFPAPHHHDPNEMLPNFCILGCGGVPFKWLILDPSRTRGFVSALVLLFFVFFLCRSTLALRLGVSGCSRVRSPVFFYVVTDADLTSH